MCWLPAGAPRALFSVTHSHPDHTDAEQEATVTSFLIQKHPSWVQQAIV